MRTEGVGMTSMRSSRTGRRVFVAIAAALVLGSLAVAVSTNSTGEVPAPREMSIDTALANFGGAADYYMKIPTPAVLGDSTNARHKDEIDLTSFSWSLTNAASAPTFANVSVGKAIDRSSPLLMKATAAGTTYATVVITADKVGSNPITFMTLTLSNARVRSFKETANRTAGISDVVTFSFTRARFRVVYQNSTGSTTPVEACWDLPSRALC
jgi:type VI secretion system secreted protein Hcp